MMSLSLTYLQVQVKGCHKKNVCSVQRATVAGLNKDKKLIVFWFGVLNVSLRFNRGSNYVHILSTSVQYVSIIFWS